MHIISSTRYSVQFIPDEAMEACVTCKLLHLHIASTDNYHTAIGLRWTHCNGLFFVHRLDEQIAIIDNISPWKVIDVCILLCVSIFWISLTIVWDIITHLCMCKGHTGHMKVIDSKLGWLTSDVHDIILPLMDMWECAIWIKDKMCQQNITQSCHASHKSSGQCVTRTCMNDHHHVAFVHTSTGISLHSDLIHMVKNMKIAYGRSWKSRRRNWIRDSAEVELY